MRLGFTPAGPQSGKLVKGPMPPSLLTKSLVLSASHVQCVGIVDSGFGQRDVWRN